MFRNCGLQTFAARFEHLADFARRGRSEVDIDETIELNVVVGESPVQCVVAAANVDDLSAPVDFLQKSID